MVSNRNGRDLVERIRQEFEESRGTRIWTDYVNALRLVSQVVFTRSSGFILELIQNAEDAGQGMDGTGEVVISVNRERLKFVHNGRAFDEGNLRAICGIRSSKKPERGTLGYLGIGFKSVFKVADCAEVYSNGLSFKFDRNHAEWANQPSGTPWHVIPIWLDEPSESIDEQMTTFIVWLRSEDAYEHLMAGLRDIKAELYLFLNWIKRIRITDEVSGGTWSLEDLGQDSDGISTLMHDDTVHKFKFFRRQIEVPEAVKRDRLTEEYRANVTQREIAIAFAIDKDGNIDPSPATAMYGGVYSFLPLGESSSGAKFPIQADFLIQPGRDAINAEAAWNHWLMEEVARLCIQAIVAFQSHNTWKYQYLAAFDFNKSEGNQAYDKLFGPKLIAPIELFLKETSCVLTIDDQWAKQSEVVRLAEEPPAAQGLVEMGIVAQCEIASAFGGEPGLHLVHPKVAEALPGRFKNVDRWTFFNNREVFKAKAKSDNAAAWFRALYCWLQAYPIHEEYFYYKLKRRPLRYDGKEIVFVADKTTVEGAGVWLVDLGASDPAIKKLAYELKKTKPMLHPDILADARDDEERQVLAGFLTGLVGVQKLDAKILCEEAILPKILTSAPKPLADELLDYTMYCQRHLNALLMRGKELWVINKSGRVRAARELLFSLAFKPVQNWELHKKYVKGSDFVCPDYVNACTTEQEFRKWREFFKAGGVKEAPDNGIEDFAMNFAIEKLSVSFKNIVEVDKLNNGYDLEAEDSSNQTVHIEVKGISTEQDVELTRNEANAAKKHGDSFYLCIVVAIPESPQAHLVRNPDGVGDRDKLTIRTHHWKPARLEGA